MKLRDHSPHRFLTLDLLRGVAAVCVLTIHLGRLFGPLPVTHAYLAVDFFFLLSGFVITFAYQQKLQSGWPFRKFFLARIVRLYPLYVLALVFAVFFHIAQSRLGHGIAPFTHGQILALTALGVFMIPALPMFHTDTATLFPLNTPSYSLLFELFANAVHGTFFRKASRTKLVLILLLSAAGEVYTVHKLGNLNCGYQDTNAAYGIFRVLFPYFFGSALFFLWRSGRIRVQVPAFLPLLLLLIVLETPVPAHWSALYDIAAVFFVLPAIVALGTTKNLAGVGNRLAETLGLASYPFYLFHMSIALSIEQLWLRLRHLKSGGDAPWLGIVTVLVITVFCLAVDRYYDVPVRKWLRRFV